jgi:hypothetical protein
MTICSIIYIEDDPIASFLIEEGETVTEERLHSQAFVIL